MAQAFSSKIPNLLAANSTKMGTLASSPKNAKKHLLVWEPLGRDRWSPSMDKEYSYGKAMSTTAYAQKLKGEEDLRLQLWKLQVPIGQMKPSRSKDPFSPWLFNEI